MLTGACDPIMCPKNLKIQNLRLQASTTVKLDPSTLDVPAEPRKLVRRRSWLTLKNDAMRHVPAVYFTSPDREGGLWHGIEGSEFESITMRPTGPILGPYLDLFRRISQLHAALHTPHSHSTYTHITSRTHTARTHSTHSTQSTPTRHIHITSHSSMPRYTRRVTYALPRRPCVLDAG